MKRRNYFFIRNRKFKYVIYYILEGKTIKTINNIIEWGKWFQEADRHINKTKITDKVEVSTVFLGLDHSFGSRRCINLFKSTPVLFETMIFGGKNDQYQKRYTTYKKAEAGHIAAVKMCISPFSISDMPICRKCNKK